MPIRNSITSHKVRVGMTSGSLNKIILENVSLKGLSGNLKRAYPTIEPSTDCEEKDVIQWRTCARFPIPRVSVTATAIQRDVVSGNVAECRLTDTSCPNNANKRCTVR